MPGCRRGGGIPVIKFPGCHLAGGRFSCAGGCRKASGFVFDRLFRHGWKIRPPGRRGRFVWKGCPHKRYFRLLLPRISGRKTEGQRVAAIIPKKRAPAGFRMWADVLTEVKEKYSLFKREVTERETLQARPARRGFREKESPAFCVFRHKKPYRMSFPLHVCRRSPFAGKIAGKDAAKIFR